MPTTSPRTWTAVDQGDLLSRATFRLTVTGRETAWVRRVGGDPSTTVFVEISLDQLTLFGPLQNLRERLISMLSLLDEVEAKPDEWKLLRPQRIGEKHWANHQPRPFVRRPSNL